MHFPIIYTHVYSHRNMNILPMLSLSITYNTINNDSKATRFPGGQQAKLCLVPRP